MSNAFDVAAALGRVGVYLDAWQFVRDFAAEWATPVTEADAVTDEELDAAEQRLGLQLPAAVRQAYLLFGRRIDLTSQSGRLYPPDELDYDHDNHVLVFRTAHQGVAFYGASLADPQQDDPHVLVYLTMMDKATESWAPFVDRFSHACVEMVLSESVEAGEHSDGRPLVEGEPASLIANLTEATVPHYRGDYSAGRWYTADDIVVRVEDDTWVGVSARTRDALELFRARHPGSWLGN